MRAHVNCYKCTKCDLSCISEISLAKHFLTKHTNERPLKCDQCDYRCINSADMETHRNRHLQKRFYCEVFGCEYSCANISSLRNVCKMNFLVVKFCVKILFYSTTTNATAVVPTSMSVICAISSLKTALPCQVT